MSSYQYKCTGIPVEQFQGRDGETAGDGMHAWGVGVGPQREVDPATLPTEERGPARTSDGVVWVDVCDGELRAIPTTIGARIDNDRGTENGTGGSPVSMRCQFADECDRRWATVERERRRADIAPDHGNSQARVLGFDSVESEPDWNAGGDRDFPSTGQDGFGTHPDDSDVWEKAETRSDGSKAGAQARGTSRCTWPVAGVRVRDDEVSWEDSGSVDCDSQDQNSYSDEEESYDQNRGYRYRDGDATAASPAPTSAPPAASAPRRGGRRDMVPSVGARDAKGHSPNHQLAHSETIPLKEQHLLARSAMVAMAGTTTATHDAGVRADDDDDEGRWGYERPRGRAITKLGGIEMGMKPAVYQAARSTLFKKLEYNLKRCGWTEEDCICHLVRFMPRLLQTAVAKKTTLQEVAEFLDKQFLPESLDSELEEWDDFSIGERGVMEYYVEIEDMAERLGKDDEAIRRCFVKGLRDEYPELWEMLRFVLKSQPLNQIVNRAKEWMEATGQVRGYDVTSECKPSAVDVTDESSSDEEGHHC